MLKLHLPPTIRLATFDELPDNADIRARIQAGQQANIVPGYTVKENQNNDLPFRFYAEINVDNELLWDVFQALAGHLPSPVCLIYHHRDERETYSPYTDREAVLNALQIYQTELAQDVLLSAGLLHYDGDYLEEVYIEHTKYFKYWGMDEGFFRQTMEHFSLSEIPDLAFIDQFPRTSFPLIRHAPGCRDTWEVLGLLLKEFGQEDVQQ